jgi:formate-dependent nitrite reductase membrane component NrfD
MSEVIHKTRRAEGTRTHRRHTPVARPNQTQQRYDGTTYYGQPAVKPSPFDWRIGAYIFLSGLAGAAQIIAGLAQYLGGAGMRPVVRNARYVAAASAFSGAVLLATELKTPGRWYNMLRIYRSTSPLSTGSYILTAFGALSGVTALGEAARRHPAAVRAADIAQVPAAIAGAGMLTYTGALLASTSTPLWAAEAPLTGARLAASGMSAGAAALSLAEQIAERPRNAAALNHVMLASNKVYALLSTAAARRRRAAGVNAPLEKGRYGPLHSLGGALIVALPAALHIIDIVAGRRTRVLPVIATLSVIAGAALTRHAYVKAGIASAQRPQDYLAYTAVRSKPNRNAASRWESAP